MRRIHFDVTDSTNSQARALAAAHAGERLLVTAAEQTAGRGRRGRVWASPRGGAWMSLAWPMGRERRAYGAVSLAVAVGVRRGILNIFAPPDGAPPPLTPPRKGEGDRASALAPTAVQIKWPNDLLIDGSKVAGILCEQVAGLRERPVATTSPHDVLIVGIGVNVDFDLAALGPAGELRYPATTLSATLGRHIEVEPVIECVARRVAEALEEYERDGLAAGLLAELQENLAFVGTVRSWSSPTGVVTGRVLGADDGGRLLMETEGQIAAYELGELQ